MAGRYVVLCFFVSGSTPGGAAALEAVAANRHGFDDERLLLVLPNVFEPDFCRRLIALHEADGGRDTGFMSEVGGKTVELVDRARKRRRDVIVEDESVILALQRRIKRRIVPEIARLHFLDATRIERYLVGCHMAEDGGQFAAHCDNPTKGAAHRRFAISIDLNDDFDGGEVSSPEYGPQGSMPPSGGAVVFSWSLIHAVSTVSRGRRYAFLPFPYDEAAARIREANNKFPDPTVGTHRNAWVGLFQAIRGFAPRRIQKQPPCFSMPSKCGPSKIASADGISIGLLETRPLGRRISSVPPPPIR